LTAPTAIEFPYLAPIRQSEQPRLEYRQGCLSTWKRLVLYVSICSRRAPGFVPRPDLRVNAQGNEIE
jgi:hypothetical protein